MSAIPAEPTPSQLPPAAQRDSNEPTTQQEPHSETQPDLPKPRLRLELRDLRHEATKTFLDHVDPTTDISKLVSTVVTLLYYSSDPTIQQQMAPTSTAATTTTTTSDRRPHPYKPHVPGTRSVTLIPEGMDGVAYTTGLALDDDHKEIHFSLSYINHVRKSSAGDKDKIREELLGVICHELVHCYQWNALGSAPGGLIEGIADWVRLRAGFVPPHWKREHGEGVHWHSGYQTTGYFLDWIEHAHGEGSIRRLNDALRDQKYEEDEFWAKLFGRSVKDLWASYGESLD